MHAFPEVRWHLLPGNHDGQQANGLRDRLRKRELPDVVVLHLAPGSHEVAGEAVLCCRHSSPAAMLSAIPPRTWTAWRGRSKGAAASDVLSRSMMEIGVLDEDQG